MACGLLLVLGGLLVTKARSGPDLQVWHRYRPTQEFHADTELADLDGYLALEDRLMEEVREVVDRNDNPEAAVSRYASASETCPWNFPVDDNRTFVLDPPKLRGGAVLLHGLSDSPHSMRALGETLREAGYRVVGLRLPGHGTFPSGLREAAMEDWQAAVRLAVADVSRGLAADQDLLLGGYSNGVALALDYTLSSLDDASRRRPDHLVFLSPAFVVTRAAAWASWVDLASRLPGLERLGWNSLNPEFDPYKYNSFTVRAGAEIFRLTRRVDEKMSRLRSQKRLDEVPPILVFQSLVDATISTVGTLERILDVLENEGSRLVLFDVNATSRSDAVLAPFVQTLRERITRRRTHPFDATLLGNRTAETREVVARHRRAGEAQVEMQETGLAWPAGVYSLSHVALPFPPDDPVYGVAGDDHGVLPLGRLELRGERRVLRIPPDLLQRLRYNPFFPYLEESVLDFLGVPSESAAFEAALLLESEAEP